MKNKGKIILLVLLLASVLLFSGCDAVLEAFYPEFAGIKITATVEVSDFDFTYLDSYSPLSIAVIPFEDFGYGLEPDWDNMGLKNFTTYSEGEWVATDTTYGHTDYAGNYSYDYFSFTEEFSVESEREYIVIAWYDGNGNGYPESGESAKVLPVRFDGSSIGTGPDIFYLHEEINEGEAYNILNSGDRLPYEIETLLFGYYMN